MQLNEQEFRETVAGYEHALSALCARAGALRSLASSSFKELEQVDTAGLPDLLEQLHTDAETLRTLATRIQALLDRASEFSHFDRDYVRDET